MPFSSDRRDRAVSDREWLQALKLIRTKPLPKSLRTHRTEIEAQTWIELRTPPVGSSASSFDDEVIQAWERAKFTIRRENRPEFKDVEYVDHHALDAQDEDST